MLRIVSPRVRVRSTRTVDSTVVLPLIGPSALGSLTKAAFGRHSSRGRRALQTATELVNFDYGKFSEPFNPISVPIYQTATFAQASARGESPYDYTRSGNPTRDALQMQLAALEGSKKAFAFSTGMAAMSSVMRLLKPGDRVIAGDDIYGGTVRLLSTILTDDLEVQYVDTTSLSAMEQALKSPTPSSTTSRPQRTLVVLESPSNPSMRISDVRAVAKLVKATPNALLCVDNTILSPIFMKPLDLGADLVVHSATKYLSGHSDTMAGVIAVSREDLISEIGRIQNAQGAGLAPFDCWLVLRGLKTLALRIERQQNNALKLAQWLNSRPEIVSTWHAGLETHPGHDVHRSQASGEGAVFSFQPKGDLATATKLTEALKIFKTTVSFGGVNSVIEIPMLLSHASVPAAERDRLHFPENLVRTSVGIEAFEDLRADMEQALESVYADAGSTSSSSSSPKSATSGTGRRSYSTLSGSPSGSQPFSTQRFGGSFPSPVGAGAARRTFTSASSHSRSPCRPGRGVSARGPLTPFMRTISNPSRERGTSDLSSTSRRTFATTTTTVTKQSNGLIFPTASPSVTASGQTSPHHPSISTLSVHAGEHQTNFKSDDAITTPIVLSSAYKFRKTDDLITYQEHTDLSHEYGRYGNPTNCALYDKLRLLNDGERFMDLIAYQENTDLSHEYGRYGNPTTCALSDKLRQLEGGEDCLFSASGMNSATTMILALVDANTRIVTTKDCYRRTRQFMEEFLPKMGVQVDVIDMASSSVVDELEALLADKSKNRVSLFFSETPTNPFLRCIDVPKVSELCSKHGAVSCVDSTFATPVNCRPLELGADLVLHSATKFLGGHNDVMAGAIAGKRDLVQKIRGMHGVLGGVLDPHASYMILRGMKTLSLRVKQHNATAMAVAKFLDAHPKISQVFYPGLTSHPDHEVAKRIMSGFGGVVSFLVNGDRKTTSNFIDALKIPFIAPSLGGVESLIEQPMVISYWDVPEARKKLGIKDNLVRFSTGLEDTDDVINDFKQALDKI